MTDNKLTEKQLDDISQSIIQGRKIDAIKAFREATGLGLKDAKDEVEKITRDLAKEHPELLKNQSKGCAGVIALGLILGYATVEIVQKVIVG